MEVVNNISYPLLPPLPDGDIVYSPKEGYGTYDPPQPTAPFTTVPTYPVYTGDEGVVGGEFESKTEPVGVPVFTEHMVSQVDTLQGLLLRYNITLRELKRWNQFPRENFKMLRKLRIPLVKGARPAPERTKAEIEYDFAMTHGISRAEAKYYLDDASYNVDEAKVAVTSDKAWEKSQEMVIGDRLTHGSNAATLHHRVKHTTTTVDGPTPTCFAGCMQSSTTK